MERKKALKWLTAFIGIELLIIAGVVVFFDPFYQYHGPLPGMESVLYDSENQVAGTIRNFSYDAVLLGSSTAENFDTDYLDAQLHTKTLKVIRHSSNVANLLYYLDMVHRYQKIDQVFWCMDLFAVNSDTDVTFSKQDTPFYLHTKSILDDIPYLFNKEIIFREIPFSLAKERAGIDTGGHAYNWDWSYEEVFCPEMAMRDYDKPAKPTAEERQVSMANPVILDPSEVENLEENVENILEEIQSHPDISYTFFFPPYSMLWWDAIYTEDSMEDYLTALEVTIRTLLTCENVKIYFFADEKDIVCNLNNYMDQIHYSPEISQYMLECIAADEKRVTEDNVDEVCASLRDVCKYIVTEGIYLYYDDDSLLHLPILE